MRYKECVYRTQGLFVAMSSLTYILNYVLLRLFALDNTDSTEFEDKFPIEFTKVQVFILFIKKTVSGREEGIT